MQNGILTPAHDGSLLIIMLASFVAVVVLIALAMTIKKIGEEEN